jgi:hypothetical protein
MVKLKLHLNIELQVGVALEKGKLSIELQGHHLLPPSFLIQS